MFKYIKIGKALKSVRSNGAMVASIYGDFVEDTINSKAIFIEIDGLNVPFFIEDIECEGNICYIKLEEFDSPEEVKKYNNSEICLRESDINWNSKQINSISDKSNFEGFEIYDINSKTSCIIESTEQFPQKLMAKTTPSEDNKTFFIPLIQEFIIDVDYINKKITMSLPEGLL